MNVRLTYYLEVVSSWCHWVEPVWADLQTRYAGRVEFGWKLALMDDSGMPTSREQCDWFYRRSGMILRSPYMLNSGWFDPALRQYLAPNLVSEAARDFGVSDDRVRLAIANAAVREGRRVGQWELAAEVGAAAAGLDAGRLLERAQSPEVAARAKASTEEFHSLRISQRPAFVLDDAIGDRAVFSGLVAIKPLEATLDAMLSDVAAYAAHKAHFGTPPPA